MRYTKTNNNIELLYDIKLKEDSKKTLEDAVDDMITGVTIGTIQSAAGNYTNKKHCYLGDNPGYGKGEVIAIQKTDEKGGIAKVVFSNELSQIEEIGFAGLMSIVAGDGLGSAYEMEKVRLIDINLPMEVLSLFKGPQFGISNIRNSINKCNSNIPLTALLLKPNTGQPSDYYAKLSYEAALAGIDYIKEDELQFNHSLCPLIDRVSKIKHNLEYAMDKTGQKVLYAPNITSRNQQKIIENAKKVVELGASAIMINVIQVGLDTLRVLREANIGVPIHVHRAGHDCYTRGLIGIDLFVLTKLFRLAGADIVHSGPIFGNLYEPNAVIKNIRILTDDWIHFKQCLPILSRSTKEIIQDSIDYIKTDNLIKNPTDVMFLVDKDIYEQSDPINGSILQSTTKFVEKVKNIKQNRIRSKIEILTAQGII